TGIVQEFQFGMNWSSYSRFVGNIFGVPLAMEALIAFFIESTFLGLWIFGWGRLPRRVHLACIWLVAIGTMISASFIIAANSWMQHPVGYEVVDGQAVLTSFFAVLTNSTFLAALAHTLLAAMLTAGMVVLGVSAYHLVRKNEVELFKRSARIALVFAFAGSLLVAFTGDTIAKVMTKQQPMKMAAGEALWDTESSAGWSIFAIGDVKDGRNSFNIQIPDALSILATDSPDGTVQGINNVQAEYEEEFGEGNYIPNVGVTYWSFRIMV
ncbi:unnamed protein product, partial [marine sediment metagenome]